MHERYIFIDVYLNFSDNEFTQLWFEKNINI